MLIICTQKGNIIDPDYIYDRAMAITNDSYGVFATKGTEEILLGKYTNEEVCCAVKHDIYLQICSGRGTYIMPKDEEAKGWVKEKEIGKGVNNEPVAKKV